MGNCITSPTPNNPIKPRFTARGNTKPVLLEELLSGFHGFGVSISNTSSLFLLPDHELRSGKAYHLVPLGAPQFSGSPDLKPPAIVNEGKEEGGSRRVKIFLTKKQLQELLSMNGSLDEMAYVAGGGGGELGEGNCGSWKPELDTIFEEVE
ncbi:hypothetical protein KSP39_PZI022717 [Platanthera zijinensis]|uniref:Uncharacterized protein n=1 Tax=Platanthera zijinensis TaxID=2320716 RepID=A0AAP0AVM0_9ASPA